MAPKHDRDRSDPKPLAFESLGGISTINDVARAAGVSIKTVSRVMNNEPNVRDETRQKVKAAASELNYRPNLLARSLAGARSFLIGLLYDNPNPSYINDMHRGVITRARQSGYHLLAEPQDGDPASVERSIKELLATIRLDGVILTPPLCEMEGVLLAIEQAGVPYVRVSPFQNPGRSACVRMDEAQAAFEMTSYLIELGHKEIGFVKGHPQHGGSHLRFEGFERALKVHGLKLNPDWIKQGYFSYESGLEAGRAFFASGAARPTAIFSSNDYMAFGIMAEAQQAGIRIPEDLSIAGFDDAPGSILIWPHLTTIRQPVSDMAYEAADLLLRRYDQPQNQEESAAESEDKGQDLGQAATEPGSEIIRLLPFRLIKRQSTRAL